VPSPRVAVVRTSPDTVAADYRRLLDLSAVCDILDHNRDINVAIDLSWHHHLPACSTAAWQLDSVIRGLVDNGYSRERIRVCVNPIASIRADKGVVLNRLLQVCEKYDLPLVFLDEASGTAEIETDSPLRVLAGPAGRPVRVPKLLIGGGLVLLPTMKTHVGVGVAGALYTAFSLLFGKWGGRFYPVFHDALLDTLAILPHVAPNILAIADGAYMGTGPGPRRLGYRQADILAASADPLALDAFIARRLGFELSDIPFIEAAAAPDRGRVVEIDGMAFVGDEDAWKERPSMPPMRASGFDRALWRLERGLNDSALGTPTSELAMAYNDWYWYITKAEKQLKPFWKSPWGKVFEGFRRDSRYET